MDDELVTMVCTDCHLRITSRPWPVCPECGGVMAVPDEKDLPPLPSGLDVVADVEAFLKELRK